MNKKAQAKELDKAASLINHIYYDLSKDSKLRAYLFGKLNKSPISTGDSFEQQLGILLANLVKAQHSFGGNKWIRLSKSNSAYKTTTCNRYLTYRIFIEQIINPLIDLGLLDYHPGYQSFFSRLSRIRASSVLVKKLKHLSESHIEYLETDMIFYRKKTRSGFNHVTKKLDYKKKKVPLAASSELNSKKLNLDFINAKLKETFIGLWLTDEQLKAVKPEKAVSLGFHGLTRNFNSADMTMGGRFYGGFWQQIPKIYRPYITIHHCLTTEFDYSYIHPSILYHWDSLSLDEDAYHLNCSWFRPELHRKSIKKIFNIILNATSKKVADSAISHKVNKEIFPVPLEEVVEAVLNKHSAISHYFYSGIWGKLQRTDSDIAEYCMLKMLNQFNAPILPIHDSFIVQMDHLNNLQQVMIEAYKHIVGGDITLGENHIVLHDPLENSNTSDYTTYFKHAELYCNKKGMSSKPHAVPDVFPF